MSEESPKFNLHPVSGPGQREVMQALTYLVVDDDNFSRILLKKFIQRFADSNVLEAEGSGHALDLLRTQKVDVMITDLRMPDMDGDGLVWCLRRSDDERLRRIPVVMISAHDDADDRASSRDAGVDEFAVKPCAPEDFQRLVRQAVLEPRTYIATADFVGPDRRRKNSNSFAGPDRRRKPN